MAGLEQVCAPRAALVEAFFLISSLGFLNSAAGSSSFYASIMKIKCSRYFYHFILFTEINQTYTLLFPERAGDEPQLCEESRVHTN